MRASGQLSFDFYNSSDSLKKEPVIIRKAKQTNHGCIDVVADYGLIRLGDIEYKGNFGIKFHSKEELVVLQKFFNVRRSGFDMRLLENREELRNKLYQSETRDV